MSSLLNKSEERFAQMKQSLNEQQLRAVETIEGPVLVVAGPGTGKTHVLSMRIAEILQRTDTKSSSILALTFTDSAAQTMRSRLASIIGTEAYYAHISTFHSFCNLVISENPDRFQIDERRASLSEIEQIQILSEILREGEFNILQPLGKPDYWLKNIKSHISTLKREAVTPEKFALLEVQEQENVLKEVAKKGIKNREQRLLQLKSLGEVYTQYQGRLRSAGLFDFDDMIVEVVKAFEAHDELLSEYQERYLYILVDEYQDTNSSQNAILRLLTSHWGPDANICAVGDPNQAIYRFQGASLENAVEFLHWFPDSEIITLTQGYRCTPATYALAHQIIKQRSHNETHQSDVVLNLETALDTQLESISNNQTKVDLVCASSREAEIINVVDSIELLLLNGIHPSDIAILYTKNNDADEIAALLSRKGIPYVVSTNGDVLHEPIIEQFVQFLQLIAQSGLGKESEELLCTVLGFQWLGMDWHIVFRLARSAGKKQQSLWELIASFSEWPDLPIASDYDKIAVDACKSVLQKIERWNISSKSEEISQWLEQILSDSGLLTFLLSEQNIQRSPQFLMAVKAFFNFVKELSSRSGSKLELFDLLKIVDTMKSQDLRVELPLLSGQEKGVVLSTVHKAKGMEWGYVFAVHLQDGIWGNRRKKAALPLPEGILTFAANQDVSAEAEKIRMLEDDRRLLYVAVTRAKHALTLSWYKQEIDSAKKVALPSIFIHDLVELGNTKNINSPVHTHELAHTAAISQRNAKILIGPRALAETDKISDYLSLLVEDYPLSVTALNNYLRDPGIFLTSNLIQIPTIKQPHQSFGTAIHEALHSYFSPNQLVDDGKTIALESYEKAIRKELKDNDRFQEWIEKGKMTLDAYLDAISDADVFQTEYAIGSGKRAAYLNTIPLKGRLDRLDWIDEHHKGLLVIDYKTGAKKSENEIRGKTQSALEKMSDKEKKLPVALQGAYYRQLLFYAVLVQNNRDLTAPLVAGQFDFVEEPAKTGKQYLQRFSISESEISLMKELIHSVYLEITSLSFLPAALATLDPLDLPPEDDE